MENQTRGRGGIGRHARFRFLCHRCAGSSPVARTSMSVHNGFKLWTLIFYSISSDLYVVSRFCACSQFFMQTLLWGYTPHLRPFGCWLCSFRPLMTVALSSRQSDNRLQCVECNSFCRLPFRTHQCGRLAL